MSNQVQCPNCGGYKTETVKVEDVSTKETVSSDERKRNTTTWLKAFPVYIVLGLIFISIGVWVNDSGNSPFLICGGIFFIVFPLYMIPRSMSQKTKRVRIGQIYNYYCYLCGYKWSWTSGTSLPKVNIRPDLIEQGNQRLEAEHRKQQEDAAALYYLTHKK